MTVRGKDGGGWAIFLPRAGRVSREMDMMIRSHCSRFSNRYIVALLSLSTKLFEGFPEEGYPIEYVSSYIQSPEVLSLTDL
jgi:hypothetical protein